MQQTQSYHGLTDAEVKESRQKYGVNILTPPAKKSLFLQFLEKFKDPLIMILIVAGVLSVIISLYEYFGLNEGAGVFFFSHGGHCLGGWNGYCPGGEGVGYPPGGGDGVPES